MRVIAINNYSVSRNFQAKTQQSNMPNQQSFGLLTINEAGMEKMEKGLQQAVREIFTHLKTKQM